MPLWKKLPTEPSEITATLSVWKHIDSQYVGALPHWSSLIALGVICGVMSRWLCRCVIPGRHHAEHCLFIHLISLFNWVCCSCKSNQIPQRSLTINSEVADTALWDRVWVRSWQGSHHSCVTCPQYIWHVPSNTNPSLLYYISTGYICSKDLHWFHSISLLSLLWLWHVCQVSFLQSIIHPLLLYALHLYLSIGRWIWWCRPIPKLSQVLTFPDVSALLPYVQWEPGCLVLIYHQSCDYAWSSTEEYSPCLETEWIDNG